MLFITIYFFSAGTEFFLFKFKFQSRLSGQKFQIHPRRVYHHHDFAYLTQWQSQRSEPSLAPRKSDSKSLALLGNHGAIPHGWVFGGYGNLGWVNYYFREGKVAYNWGGIDRGVMAKYKYLGEEQMHGILLAKKTPLYLLK